jgi:hypothetical protein
MVVKLVYIVLVVGCGMWGHWLLGQWSVVRGQGSGVRGQLVSGSVVNAWRGYWVIGHFWRGGFVGDNTNKGGAVMLNLFQQPIGHSGHASKRYAMW